MLKLGVNSLTFHTPVKHTKMNLLKLGVNSLTFHTPVKHTKMNFNSYNYNSFDVFLLNRIYRDILFKCA